MEKFNQRDTGKKESAVANFSMGQLFCFDSMERAMDGDNGSEGGGRDLRRINRSAMGFLALHSAIRIKQLKLEFQRDDPVITNEQK